MEQQAGRQDITFPERHTVSVYQQRNRQAIATMQHIVTLTVNPAVDVNTSVDQVAPEKKLRCGRPRREPGGGGLNVARAVKRLGGTSAAYYTAGGPPGDILRHLLDEEAVEHYAIRTEDWTRENLIVSEDASEQQFRFGMPGPALREEEWQQCLDALAAVDPAPGYLVASGSLPPGVPDDFYAHVGRIAGRQGARFILDTSGEALRYGVREGGGTYLLKPNLRELQQLAGEALDSEQQQERFARDLIEQELCEVVVLSLGGAGALVVTTEEAEHVRSPTVPIRSKVGAGDSTVAGLVLALARGWALRDAVRFGIAAGAAAVMTPGTELCRRADTERLYEQLKQEVSSSGRPGSS